MKIEAKVSDKIVFSSTFPASELVSQYASANRSVQASLTKQLLEFGDKPGEVQTSIEVSREAGDDALKMSPVGSLPNRPAGR